MFVVDDWREIFLCLINFAYHVHPHYKLVVSANRDEFYARKTKHAHFWDEYPFLLGGKDLEQGGMWLGITKEGKFAALTNYREKISNKKNYRSRGELVKNFLIGNDHAYDYLKEVERRKNDYPGFNLLVGYADELYYYSNRYDHILKLEKGIYSLCNSTIDCEWEKAKKGKRYMEEVMSIRDEEKIQKRLFASLLDEEKAPDELLPDTGLDKELERFLSSIFIKGEDYGTRSSTVILVGYDNRVIFSEKTYDTDKKTHTFSFMFEKR